MFSKPIFKQSVRSNGALWLVITLVASALFSNFIIRFDPADFGALSSAVKGQHLVVFFLDLALFWEHWKLFIK